MHDTPGTEAKYLGQVGERNSLAETRNLVILAEIKTGRDVGTAIVKEVILTAAPAQAGHHGHVVT
jgi:hypothetical protein